MFRCIEKSYFIFCLRHVVIVRTADMQLNSSKMVRRPCKSFMILTKSFCVFTIEICEAPPTIANAEVMRYNNRAMYSCMEGYRSMSGNNKINCTESEWQTTTFSCYGRIHLYRVD